MASNIRITFLGTGGSWPSPGRGLPAISLQIDEISNLLDCGEGTQKQMMKLGVSFMSVDNVFITHFHGDHFLGLLGLVQSMSFNGRSKDLNIYGPKGAVNILSSALNIGYYRLGFKVKVTELEAGTTYDFGKFYLDTLKNDHTVPAISYRFREKDLVRIDRKKAEEAGVPMRLLETLRRDGQVTAKGQTFYLWQVSGGIRPGRRVVYTGDTRPFDGMVGFSQGADVLIHETTTDSSLEPKVNEFGHSSSRQAAEIAKKAGVRRFYLFHYSPRYESPEPMLKEARSIFQNSEASVEGLTVDVPVTSSE